MAVPDRALWLLQHYNIKVTPTETLGIKLTDGLYDEGNKKYLMTYNPDWELRSNIFHILHQADMMSTKIEYDAWKYNTNETKSEQRYQTKNYAKKQTKQWVNNSVQKKSVVTKEAPVGKNMELYQTVFNQAFL